LLVADTDKSYQADPNQFMKVLNRRVDVPNSLKDHTEMLYDYVLGF
jgi:hypothetical protein